MNNYHHVLVDAKNEYTKQLMMVLTIPILEGIQSIYDYTKKYSHIKDYQFFKHFQNLLSNIPKWTDKMLHTEYKRIIQKTNCDWINDLITAVFVSHTKILTMIKVNKNTDKTIDLKIPNPHIFIHKCYIEVARQFWKRPYLFDHRLSNIETQRNLNESEKIIGKSIEETIRKLLPVKNILKEYLGNDYQDDMLDDISECIPRTHQTNLHKMIQKDLELSVNNVKNIDDNYSNYELDIDNDQNILESIEVKTIDENIENLSETIDKSENVLIEDKKQHGGNIDMNEPNYLLEKHTENKVSQEGDKSVDTPTQKDKDDITILEKHTENKVSHEGDDNIKFTIYSDDFIEDESQEFSFFNDVKYYPS